MNLIAQWKQGTRILIRLIFLGGVMNVGLAPILFLGESLRSSGIGFILSGLYFLLILPFFLQWFLDIAGLECKGQSEVDCQGGMNESTRKKVEELRKENRA